MNNGKYGLPKRAETYRVYDPFCPPQNPSSLNDEFGYDFVGDAPPGWVSVGVQTPVINVRLGVLEFVTAAVGGTSAAAIERRGLGPVFTVATKVTQLGDATLSIPGLFVRSSVTGRIMSANAFINSTLLDNYVSFERLTSFSARDSVGFVQTGKHEHFFRITSDGTTIKVQFSYDGVRWIDRISESIATWFSGGAPDSYGLCLRAESGNQPRASFDFIRHFNTYEADIGRMVTRVAG